MLPSIVRERQLKHTDQHAGLTLWYAVASTVHQGRRALAQCYGTSLPIQTCCSGRLKHLRQLNVIQYQYYRLLLNRLYVLKRRYIISINTLFQVRRDECLHVSEFVFVWKFMGVSLFCYVMFPFVLEMFLFFSYFRTFKILLENFQQMASVPRTSQSKAGENYSVCIFLVRIIYYSFIDCTDWKVLCLVQTSSCSSGVIPSQPITLFS
jgi:hypothetical protein